MGVYPEGLRIHQVLINFPELFQTDLKALAFFFPESGLEKRRMWLCGNTFMFPVFYLKILLWKFKLEET